jgi:hypothetical protein
VAFAALLLSACGGGSRQDANEPSGNFTVAVTKAQFPASQRLAEHAQLVLVIRNTSSKTIPDIAVSICNETCAYQKSGQQGQGTSSEAFAEDIGTQFLANPSRPVWVVDRPPGPCGPGPSGYSCQSGGAGGAVTAYANTWALGALKPGASARFAWGVTAVKAGKHVVAWQVAAGLNGKAKAVLADGSTPQGKFTVAITHAPQRSYVTGSGKIVPTQ